MRGTRPLRVGPTGRRTGGAQAPRWHRPCGASALRCPRKCTSTRRWVGPGRPWAPIGCSASVGLDSDRPGSDAWRGWVEWARSVRQRAGKIGVGLRVWRRGLRFGLPGCRGRGSLRCRRRWLSGCGSSGKSVEVLDGDVVRTNLSAGLSFSKEDRDINVRRIGFVANLLSRNGVVAVTAAISPYRGVREEVRRLVTGDGGGFVEVFVKCPIEVLAERDVKGLYKKALAGEIDAVHRGERSLRSAGRARSGDRFLGRTVEASIEKIMGGWESWVVWHERGDRRRGGAARAGGQVARGRAGAGRSRPAAVAISTAFGPEGCALVAMAAALKPDVKVFTVDTDFLFRRVDRAARRSSSTSMASTLEVLRGRGHARRAEPPVTGSTCGSATPTTAARCARSSRPARAARARRLDRRAAPRPVEDARRHRRRRALRARRRARRWCKVNPLAHWTRKDTWDYLLAARGPVQPAARSGLQVDRLLAVHRARRRRRRRARRSLGRAEGRVRHPHLHGAQELTSIPPDA